ncbi:hypothetical protein MTR67_042566 [Solanum verrucosum]|uniref:Uncharacterized protein n=1 Tax=Solanum verrucosum TaxID=315347 RepID=A0AAF0UQ85_SOLVR|nr:hypothetical protein MTR67_042566 [Solanum verrucosum]
MGISHSYKLRIAQTRRHWKNYSKIFPTTNGQAKKTIHTLEDMLRSCEIDFKGRVVDPLLAGSKIREVAYELELSMQLTVVHLVFHIYMLKKCVGNSSFIVPLETV